MKINVQIDVCEDDSVNDIENQIIQEAAKKMINEVFSNRYDHYGRTFREKLHDEVRKMITTSMDTDFKESVKEGVVEDLTKRYVRTKQYKEIKEEFEIDTDAIIKSGMKDIITEIVKVEIKKCFK